MQQECLYVIQHNSSGLVKIGVTGNWQSRSKQLYVGLRCQALIVVACDDNYYEENELHCDYDEQRIPRTEWFHLNKRQTKVLIKRVSALGEEIKWRPGDVKPKVKRRPRPEPDPINYFSEKEVARLKAKLLALPFVTVVEAYVDHIFVYGREVVPSYFSELKPICIGEIYATAGLPRFEHCFTEKKQIGTRFATEDENEFFETFQMAAEWAYEDTRDRLLMSPGFKVCIPNDTKAGAYAWQYYDFRLADGIRQETRPCPAGL